MRALILAIVFLACTLLSGCKTEYVLFEISKAVDKVYKEHRGECTILKSHKSKAIQIDVSTKCFERNTGNVHVSTILDIKHAKQARYEFNTFMYYTFKPVQDLVLNELMRHTEMSGDGKELEIVLYRVENVKDYPYLRRDVK